MTADPDQVAIVGMAVLFPGARDLPSYWRNLRDGVDAITDLPARRWDERFYAADAAGSGRPDRLYCRRGGFIDDLIEVDVAGFGIMPSSVPGIEPDQLIALQVAADAIADAGGERSLPEDRTRVGVILGRGGYQGPAGVRMSHRVRTATQLVHTLGELIPDLDPATLDRIHSSFTAQLGPYQPESAIGAVPNLAASRIANRLDLHGPAYTVDAACASSLVAVDSAVAELARGRCDVMLAGGVHHCHDVTLWSTFTQLGALSPSQRIRPLDRAADGLLVGEGTGVVVLKRLADAEASGDRVYAVIRGTGVASDGHGVSLMNPASAGQVRAMRQAWRVAGLDPSAPGALGLLEAHGTATPAGDAAELATLAEVFGMRTGGEAPAVIGSVKSMIGHAMPAAGVASLVKSVLAVYHATLLPTLHCTDPHPVLDKTRFMPIDTARPWDDPRAQPIRRAGVNAFGFGGINAHVLIEQAPGGSDWAGSGWAGDLTPRQRTTVSEPERVLRLAADSPARLAELLDVDDTALLNRAVSEGEVTGGSADGAGPVRLGIVAPNPKRLAMARAAVARQRSWRGRGDVWFCTAPLLGRGGGKLAFVFPGLEAEFAPRVADIAEHFGLAGLPSMSDSLVGHVGRHGAAVVRLGRLLHAALERMSITPDAIAGHSLGEWTGMACSGLVSSTEVDEFLKSYDPDVLRVPMLAYAVLGAPAQRVADELGAHPDVVLSHDNAPNQSILCGPPGPVEELVGRFRRCGVVAQVLPFQSGFHTPMLAPYLDSITAAVGRHTLQPPRVAMWSATTAAEYPGDMPAVRELIVRHLLAPVRFRPLIEAMHATGVTAFVQLGCGQLGSLISDTLRGAEHLVVAATSPHHDGLAQLRRVATALWADGYPDRHTASHPPQAPRSTVRLDLSDPLLSLPAEHRPRLAGRTSPATESAERNGAEAADAPPASSPNGGFTGVLRVSTETMPYLLDHCFCPQRPDWPDEADRYPVVPGTTLVAQFADVAERVTDATAVAVRDVALNRWLAASPPIDVMMNARPAGQGVLTMSAGQYAAATVELADGYPVQAPTVWSFDPASERRPEQTAAGFYRDRWMFHGPAFQGVTELTAIGKSHVRGVLTTPPAPGGLLDNAGQLLAYWILATHRRRAGVLPTGMGAFRFFGPHPALGSRVQCSVRITALTDATLEADMQLVCSGQVWAEITGWVDRRFDGDPIVTAVERAVERNTLSQQQPGGWELVFERWPDLATRELVLRRQTGSAERADYECCRPPARRQWLLGRIAVKDAVRRWLWEHGAGPVFPAEIQVRNDAAGRPRVSGMAGRALPELSVSLAHSAEAGVAIIRPRGGCAGVGIDVEEVCERSDAARLVAMGAAEQALFEQVCARSDESQMLWFTRFWAAKEAVAKAGGTGLAHRPRAFEVRRAGGDELVVAGPGGDYDVQVRQVSNPPELPARNYVVAWTVKASSEGAAEHE
ncbi:MAG: beta-ketoacyl synthase N-terminal-like domain-containing protein [Pseudonocardiaceae bacterium]